MRVLVTGASGYIGRVVAAELTARGADVHTASLGDMDLLAPGAPAQLIRRVAPDAVAHLAWNVTPGAYWTSPENARWRDASIALAAAAASSGVTRFVGAGTCAEYDWAVTPCDDSSPVEHPATVYGQAKLAAWQGVRAHAGGNFSTAWARIFLLFGDDEHPSRLVPSVALSLQRGEPALCTHGGQLRPFLHVRDVGAAIAALVMSPATGVVNIAAGEPRRVRDVIEGLATRLGRPDLVRLGARPTNEPDVLVARTERLAQEVGWSPSMTFEQALDAAADHWAHRALSASATPRPPTADR